MRTLKICRSQTLRKYLAWRSKTASYRPNDNQFISGRFPFFKQNYKCLQEQRISLKFKNMFGMFVRSIDGSRQTKDVLLSSSSEMNVIDNQRILNQLSNKLEPRQA